MGYWLDIKKEVEEEFMEEVTANVQNVLKQWKV
jgi:hypothetical protein